MPDSDRILAHYRIAAPAAEIAARARAIAVEQSVEMPLEAIADSRVLSDIVGRVEAIEDRGDAFRVTVSLSAETVDGDAGQLMNVLFGNSSLHDDVTLENADLPGPLAARFGGPRVDMATRKARAGATGRPMSCAALKPQGLSVAALAQLAGRLALGGVDVIKDDHGLADQAFSPFAERVAACAAAVRTANAETGGSTLYAPSVTGDLDRMRAQLRLAADEGLSAALIAPMISGLPAFRALAIEFPHMALIAHPAMGGAQRIAAPLLIGKLFRLFGASAVIFPTFGGRFGYSAQTCAEIAAAARSSWPGVSPALPAPAGGVTLERLDEIVEFFGRDAMILIGGALLAAPDVTACARQFATRLNAFAERP
ncbi:MAG: RuBisCO large subunit C-terminal-like domain-containing protein [Hyphomicrobiales bacterium]|nr:RuBisCO large subunit C-terminal-like domain-containing protein [Hyphomicrobiales bacterium]